MWPTYGRVADKTTCSDFALTRLAVWSFTNMTWVLAYDRETMIHMLETPHAHRLNCKLNIEVN